MKKRFLVAIIWGFTATSLFCGQGTQSISFLSASPWVPGTSVDVDVFLTFDGYNALGTSYWLEVSNAIAPYISITNVQYFTFPNHGQLQYPMLFNSTTGTTSGYMSETQDLGASANPSVPSGTYHISTMTFSLTANTPAVSFTMLTTSHSGRISEVMDTDFNDHTINPPGMFTVSIIPEPSTLALLSFAAVGALVYPRRNR